MLDERTSRQAFFSAPQPVTSLVAALFEPGLAASMRAGVEYDLQYLRNWNLALDLQIIARTVRLLISDRHAY